MLRSHFAATNREFLSTMFEGFAATKLRKFSLSPRAIELCVNQSRVRSYSTGDFIWKKGQALDHWTFVISGLAVATISAPDRPAIHVGIFSEDTWFGEFSIVNKKASYADYLALTSVDTLQIPSELVLQLMKSEPAFCVRLMELVSWRMQSTAETLILMRLASPDLRTVLGLAQFAEALMYKGDRPPTNGFFTHLVLPFSQTTFASLVGVSRSRLSGFFQKLVQADWLRCSYGNIEILNLQVWHRLLAKYREDPNALLPSTIEDIISELDSKFMQI